MKQLLASGVVMAAALGLAGLVLGADSAAPAAKTPAADHQAGAVQEQESVSQYGITWTFDQKVPVGRFITGDYYVVGPVTVKSVAPAPTGAGKEFHNGSMLNPPMETSFGYDGRDEKYLNAKLTAKFPVAMTPGDALVSTIGYEAPHKVEPHVLTGHNHGEKSEGWIKTAAVLTCLKEAAPADTFRPSYAGHQPKLYHFSDLHLELLPALEPTASAPPLALYERVFERPWIDHVYNWGSRSVHPTENMPDYGREIGRAVGEASLLLMCNYPLEQKKKLLAEFVQDGIDLWGVVQRGGQGWPAQGGFGNGRKWPIVFAGLLFEDAEMQKPKAEFDEDQHTGLGPCWTGAGVVFTGQYPDAYRITRSGTRIAGRTRPCRRTSGRGRIRRCRRAIGGRAACRTSGRPWRRG